MTHTCVRLSLPTLFALTLAAGSLGCSSSETENSEGWQPDEATVDTGAPSTDDAPDVDLAPPKDVASDDEDEGSGTRDDTGEASEDATPGSRDNDATSDDGSSDTLGDTSDARDDVAPDADPDGGAPPQKSCNGTRGQLRIGDSVSDTLPRGRGSVDEASCTSVIGQEDTYSLYVPKRMEVRIWTRNKETAFTPVLTLLDGCQGDRERACSDPLTGTPDGVDSLIRTVLEPGNYRLRIDEDSGRGPGRGGRYTIRTEAIDLAANATCSGARVLTPGQGPVRVVPKQKSLFGDRSSCFG